MELWGLSVGPVEGLEHPCLKKWLCAKYNHMRGQGARNPDPEPGGPLPVIHPGPASLPAHRAPSAGPRASPQAAVSAAGLSHLGSGQHQACPPTQTPAQAFPEGRGEPRSFLCPLGVESEVSTGP